MWLLAFITGLLGSLHCVGMCGPLVLAFPSAGKPWSVVIKQSLYHLGKITTYVLLGILMGATGKFIAWSSLQSHLMWIVGVFILIITLLPYLPHRYAHAPMKLSAKFTGWVFRYVKPTFGFGFGMLNGLIPCGMVYMAAASAATTSNVLQGAIYMVFFGLGTMPALVGITLLKDSIFSRYSLSGNKFKLIAGLCIAAFFILKGLHLGIPMLSPSFDKDGKSSCCKPQKPVTSHVTPVPYQQ